MWVLCILLQLNLPTVCTGGYRTESDCWDAGRLWHIRARAWAKRNEKTNLSILYTCRLRDPPVPPPN